MSTAATQEQARLVAEARRRLNNLASFVRARGLTGWVKDRNASGQYRRAFAAVVKVEDALGIDHPTTIKLSERLRSLYYEARAAGLLSPEDIIWAEREALKR